MSFTWAPVATTKRRSAIIGGEPRRFRPLVDLYRETGKRAGHSLDQLKVGIHAIGYVADTDTQAADDFFPGYARMFTEIGKERGWSPTRREHFDALLGPTGALIISNPKTVVAKMLHYNKVLGGIDSIHMQMSPGTLPHAKTLRGIELLGQQVAPIITGKK